MSSVSTSASAPADAIDISPRGRAQKPVGAPRPRQGQIASRDAVPAGKGAADAERRFKARSVDDANAIATARSPKSGDKVDGDSDQASFVDELGRLEMAQTPTSAPADKAATVAVVVPAMVPANTVAIAQEGTSKSAPSDRPPSLRLPMMALSMAAQAVKSDPPGAVDPTVEPELPAGGDTALDMKAAPASLVASDAVDDTAAVIPVADDAVPAPDARIKAKVTGQEAHFAFTPSSYAMSARTVAGLALARTEPPGKAGESVKEPKIGPAKDVNVQGSLQTTASPQAVAPSSNAAGGDLANAFGSAGDSPSPATTERRPGQAVDGDKPAAKVEANAKLSGIEGSFAETKTPAQQLVDHIVNASKESQAVAGDAQMPSPAQKVLRKLDITLQPPNLGEVQIKLALAANALDVQISATNPETAQMLARIAAVSTAG